MLLRCQVSNHRSINEPVELTMIAVDRNRPAVRKFERLAEDVLTVAGIYGPNASGKSNVIDSITWLSAAVRSSLRAWDDQIPREPFRFRNSENKSSEFEISIEIQGVRYDYLLEVNDSEIVFEALYSWPERRRRMLFEREGEDPHFGRSIVGLGGVRELLTPTTLFLSAATRFAPNPLADVSREIGGIRTLGLHHRMGTAAGRGFAFFAFPGSTTEYFDNENYRLQPTLFEIDEFRSDLATDVRSSALSLLQFADLGIEEVEIVRDDTRRGRRAQFIHRLGDQVQRFEFDDESAGTRTWYRLIGPVLSALRTGRVLLFDEIDASLHPRLSARLLDLFHDPETNPRGAQLIFTTHDTTLLNHLNRDEVWLTEKQEGSTTLTALSDYGGDQVRKSLNLERAYLQGRFGAVPQLDQTFVRDALGLQSESGS